MTYLDVDLELGAVRGLVGGWHKGGHHVVGGHGMLRVHVWKAVVMSHG